MRSRKGFTIIELLAVITIIGVLVTIALPKLQATRAKATIASMISDLRQLVVLQEGFYTQHNDYAGGVWAQAEQGGLGGAGRISFTPSPGNTITLSRLVAGGEVGWRATVTNPSLTDATRDECGIYIGHISFAPDVKVTHEGAAACY